MRFLSDLHPAVRYLADASYWLYLIHIPVVIALQLAMYGLAWPALTKFALVLAVALPLMLASYHTMVRYTFVGWLLNGRKRTKATASTELLAPSEAGLLRNSLWLKQPPRLRPRPGSACRIDSLARLSCASWP